MDHLEISIIDISPRYQEFGPTEILYGGSKITFSEKYKDLFEVLYKKLKENKLDDARKFVYDAVMRGYASISTTPVAYFFIKGSRLLDLFLTAIPYTSALVLSQRYVTPKIIFEDNLLKEAYDLYKKMVKNNIPKEVARRILPIGTTSAMLYTIPLNVLGSLWKFIKLNKNYIPEEIHKVVKGMIEEIRKHDSLINYIRISPEYNIPIKNRVIFKEETKFSNEETIIYEFLDNTRKDSIKKYESFQKDIIKNPPSSLEEAILNSWKLSEIAQEISDVYQVKIQWIGSLAMYNELKRHRTIPLYVESIYSAIKKTLNEERKIFVPKIIRASDFYVKYIDLSRKLLEEFESSRSVYYIPHSLQLAMQFVLSLDQLLSPYLFYGIRSCITAEFEIREKVWDLPKLILTRSKYKEFAKRLYNLLVFRGLSMPKCRVGMCPEPKGRNCRIINNMFPQYHHEKFEKERAI